MNNDAHTILRLGRLSLYSEFKEAFVASTGLPLRLRPMTFWKLAHRDQPNENPFWALIAKTSPGSSACLETEQRAIDAAQDRPATVRCFAGLYHTAVPVKLGHRLMGFLQTGQVALEPPSASCFQTIIRQLAERGIRIDLRRLREAYYHSTVLSQSQYSGCVQLVEIFARQLALSTNQMLIQDAEAEPPRIRQAKAYIAGHHGDPISLDDVARAVHVSTFYFCKRFKNATGLTFTDYLGRVRVEKAKHLLLNPHLRVSEIAYAVGFQSLTHFNRLFKLRTGMSPTRFRDDAKSSIQSVTRNVNGRSYTVENQATIRVMRLAA
jgi:AraC-like DNA-binding protein